MLMMNKIIEDKWVTIIGCLLLFSVQFIANMVIVALPSMSSNLHLDFEMENAINLVFLITSVSLMVPLGTYVSKYGIGRYLKISLLLMIFALVTLQLPSDKLGSALGIMGSCGYVGLCLSNTVSGFIVYYFGWRVIFLVLIPVYIVTLLILIKLDKEWYIEGIEISDHIGSILYVIFMILFLYGITRLDNNNLEVIIASLVIFGIFVYFERHISNPRYDLRIFRNLKYLIGNYSAFVMYAMAFIASYILNFYLQYVLGYDSRWTGLFLLSTPVAVVFVSSFAGKLADRVDERIISSIALVFILIDVLLLFFMDVVPLYMLLVACILQGIGHGLFSSPNNRFVLTQVSEKDLSNASAVLSTSKDVGKSISLAMFTVISGFFMGSANTYDGNVSAFLLPSKITLAISLLLGISALILLILNRLKD